MSKEMKLLCPLCKTEFITNRRDKVWCSSACRKRFAYAKKGVEENHDKQRMFLNPNLEYNLETDKFKIKGWIPTSN